MLMTDLQIQYYKANEDKRHNLATEALTNWINRATAATNQMNAETNRLNYGVNAANAETNRNNMLINSRNADTNAANSQINYYNMLVNRANADTNRINANTNVFNANTNRMNANTNRMNANTNAFNAQTNRLNYDVNRINAATNARNAATNEFNAQTQLKRYMLDANNAEYQRRLWSAEANYKEQITDPTVRKLNAEALKATSGGNSNGSGGRTGIAGILGKTWLANDLNKLYQMANGTADWLESDKSSQWYGSMLSQPGYTTASFVRLLGKTAHKVYSKPLDNKEYINDTAMTDYPEFWYKQMNDKYGIWH